MEFLLSTITFLLLVGLIIGPIILFRLLNKTNLKFKFAIFVILSLILTAIITFVFAWWAYTSDLIMLKHYGYDLDGMNETEFYGNVLPEHMEKVKNLEMNIMGIGWPLKAILTWVYYSPYLLLVFLLIYWVSKKRNKLI
ncbi:MAG: hypothetical protein IT220_01460 [Flavobacteriaceae bacterium]|nr:hypothetical protein [Flavobacteriaceae bacterium]